MTDQKLINRLREGATWDDDIAAANRIEELVKEVEAAQHEADEADAYAWNLENKLAKAEKERDEFKSAAEICGKAARAMLAELTPEGNPK